MRRNMFIVMSYGFYVTSGLARVLVWLAVDVIELWYSCKSVHPYRQHANHNNTVSALPEEILQLIVEQLHTGTVFESRESSSARAKTLPSLCLSSRACNRIARPILYNTFHTGHHGYEGVRFFLRTLIKRPELAQSVRELYIGHREMSVAGNHNACFTTVEVESPFTVEDYLAAASKFRRKNASVEAMWIADLRLGRRDAEVALCLSLCSRVERLVFEDCTLDRWGYLRPNWITTTIIQAVDHHKRRTHADDMPSATSCDGGHRPVKMQDAPLLAKLREVELRHQHDESPRANLMQFRHLDSLIALPAIQSIRARGVALMLLHPRRFEPSSPSTLKHLYVGSSTFSEHTLHEVLKICPALESLSIVDEGEGASSKESQLTYAFITHAVCNSRIATSLQKLTLHLHHDRARNARKFPNFSSLTGLHTLSVSAEAFLVTKRGRRNDSAYCESYLPSSLRYMEVDCSRRPVGRLFWVVMEGALSLTSLEKVCLRGEFSLEVLERPGWAMHWEEGCTTYRKRSDDM